MFGINLFKGFSWSFTVPAKPTSLKVINVRRRQSSFDITVTWEKPTTTANGITDTSTLKYYLGYKNLENNARRQRQSFTERITLSNIKAVSRYDIQVRAYKTFNAQMVGSWSDSLTLKTNESSKYWIRNYVAVPKLGLDAKYFPQLMKIARRLCDHIIDQICDSGSSAYFLLVRSEGCLEFAVISQLVSASLYPIPM